MPASRFLLPKFSACRRLLPPIFLSIFVLQLPALAQTSNKIQKLIKPGLLKKRAAVDSLVARNDVYEIVLENTLGNGVGLFTIRTGKSHPINNNFDGQRQNLLGGGSSGELGTSYLTVRCYSCSTDYVQSDFIENEPGFKTVWLDEVLAQTNQLNAVQPIRNQAGDTTGYEVIYDLPGKPLTRGQMRLTQRLQVHGNTFNNSLVEVTAKVKNTGSEMLAVGIRYLLDLNVGGDDGAKVIESALRNSLGKTETEFKKLNFGYFRAEANDSLRNLPPPEYQVYGSVITPRNLLQVGHQPTFLQQVSWPLAFLRPFTYQIHPTLTITEDARGTDPANRTGGDNAILYFWGETAGNAFKLAPGDSVQVTQGFFATPPGVLPSFYDRTPPTCTFTFRGISTVTGFFSDVEDGIAAIQPLLLYNAKLMVDPFTPGDKKVNFRLESLDQDSYIGFDIKVADLSGNTHVCDPVMSYLSTDRDNRRYTFKFRRIDRYLTLTNRGLSEIRVDLNGHRFGFYANSHTGARLRNAYRLPAEGSITIDLQPYLRDEENIMQLEIAGRPGANADLTLIDEAHQIDHTLALAPIPQSFALSQNLPNPFSRNGGATTIRFDVPELANGAGRVELKIYNMLGQLVRTLVDADLPPGAYTATWNGRDANGRSAANGVYFYNLTANGIRLTKKMALLR